MIVLGIESSCDETAAALLQDGPRILSSTVASQIHVHVPYGGVVPELAGREHVDNICHVVECCFREADRQGFSVGWKDLGAVAVTRGPGLIGALMVGLAYAKGLAYALRIPFYGINHLQGHLASVFLEHPQVELPALSMVVSGGHTSLFYLSAPSQAEEIARTRDDAAGEALDKLAKFLGLGYPGGPVIERLARLGDPQSVRFSLPKFRDESIDFSYSGLKSAAIRYVQQHGIAAAAARGAEAGETPPQPLLDLIASYQSAVIDQLLERGVRALKLRRVASVHVSGGVSCNQELRRRCAECFACFGLPVYFPRPALTTDNAAMIAAAALMRVGHEPGDAWDLPADPNLALGRASAEG